MRDNILKDYERLETCEKDSVEYENLVNKIIQVGETPNIKFNLIQLVYWDLN